MTPGGVIRVATQELTIRRYEARDHGAVVRLHRKGLQQMGADAGAGPWDDDLNDIEGVYLHGGGDFVVATVADEVVGMGALRRTGPRSGDLKRLRVQPERQGHGIGERVARHLMQRAVELGMTDLTADTTSRQLPAQQLLQKLGFAEVRRNELTDLTVIYYHRRVAASQAGGR